MGKDGYTEEDLLRAAADGDLQTVYNCIWDNVNFIHNSPLCLAARFGHDKIVTLLLENCADSQLMDDAGATPLHWAANFGHEAVLKILGKYDKQGGVVNIKDNYGSTPLHFAAAGNNEGAINLLISSGTDTLATNNAGFKASQVTTNEIIRKALIQEEEKQVLGEKALKKGVTPTTTTNAGRTSIVTKNSSQKSLDSVSASSNGALNTEKEKASPTVEKKVKKKSFKPSEEVVAATDFNSSSNSIPRSEVKTTPSAKPKKEPPPPSASSNKEVKVKTLDF